MSSEKSTRQKILHSALKLIRRRGGADVSLGDVAAAAKVSRQAIYLHFRDRADLLVDLVRYVDESRGLPEKISQIRRAPSGIESMRAMVALQASDNPILWPIARVFDAVRRSDEAVEQSWQDRLGDRLNGCREIIARVKQDGRLRAGMEENVAVDLLWTMTSLRMWEDLVLLRGWSAAKYEAHMNEILERLLIEPAGTGGG